ncbi:MAG: patatin-like phospholipase family protein [bacterium]|nr:patatin-like phospholipase family protein [bacterium]
MSDRELTAIVCSGGGMRSAHGAGFLYALATQLGITAPDVMVGSSGDAGNVMYFSAGQVEGMKRIWTELLSTPKFISPLRFWRMMDIDYLVDTVFKNQEPLDVDRLNASKINWFVPINDFDTGHTRYVSAEDALDPFEILRATTADPIIFGRKVPIAGKRYIDGELGPVLQDHVTQALRQGVKKILVLNHTSPRTIITRAIMRGYAAHLPHGMRNAVIRDISTNVFAMTAPGAHVIAVAPQNLPVWKLTRDQKKLQQTFDQGVRDALSIEKELRNLFSASSAP